MQHFKCNNYHIRYWISSPYSHTHMNLEEQITWIGERVNCISIIITRFNSGNFHVQLSCLLKSVIRFAQSRPFPEKNRRKAGLISS